MSRLLQIEISDDILLNMKKSPEDFTSELRLAAAVKWHELSRISQDRAAEIAGLSRSEFIFSLKQFNVSPFQESVEDVIEAVDKV